MLLFAAALMNLSGVVVLDFSHATAGSPITALAMDVAATLRVEWPRVRVNRASPEEWSYKAEVYPRVAEH